MSKSLSSGVWLAFGLICIIWGTTYLGVKIAVDYFPPFWLSAIRHLSASVVFFILYFSKNRELPTLQEVGHMAVVGILMITFGNAFVALGLKSIPSGLSGILSAMAPLYVTVLSIFMLDKFRTTPQIWAGLFLSIGGIVLLSSENGSFSGKEGFYLAIVLTIVANLFWAFGSIYLKRLRFKMHLFMKTALQMSIGGFVNLMIALAFEPAPKIAEIGSEGWLALAYLILVGTLVGYFCFVYLTEKMAPARLSIHVYVNTIVAVLVGWFWKDEPLSALTFGAMVVILSGVLLVNNAYAKLQNEKK
jgi:drug/metabolite transporter (DMT)-like permease